MKHKIRTAALCAALTALAACSSDEPGPVAPGNPGGEWSEVTVKASVRGTESRSVLDEVADGALARLKFAFSDGDVVLIANEQGQYVGEVSVPAGGGGSDKATLSGSVFLPEGKSVIHAVFLGNRVSTAACSHRASVNKYTIPLASQSGLASAYPAMDVLTCQTTAIKNGQNVTFSLDLLRRMSFYHARMVFPDGVAPDEGSSVTVTGMNANQVLDFSTLAIGGEGEDIPMTFPAPSDNSLYLTVAPGAYSLKFTATANGLTWEKETARFSYAANYLYSDGLQRGSSVTMQHRLACSFSYDANRPADADAAAVVTGLPVRAEQTLVTSRNTRGEWQYTAGAAPALDGYEFKGWNTKADGTGTPYAAGAQITVTDNFTADARDVTLYAQWEAAGPSFDGTAGNIIPEDF